MPSSLSARPEIVNGGRGALHRITGIARASSASRGVVLLLGLPIWPEVGAIALSLELIRGHGTEAGFEGH